MAFLSSGCAGVVGKFSSASGNDGLAWGVLILDKERTKAFLGKQPQARNGIDEI